MADIIIQPGQEERYKLLERMFNDGPILNLCAKLEEAETEDFWHLSDKREALSEQLAGQLIALGISVPDKYRAMRGFSGYGRGLYQRWKLQKMRESGFIPSPLKTNTTQASSLVNPYTKDALSRMEEVRRKMLLGYFGFK